MTTQTLTQTLTETAKTNTTAVRAGTQLHPKLTLTFPDGTTQTVGGKRAGRANFVIVQRIKTADEFQEMLSAGRVRTCSTRGGRQLAAHTWTIDEAEIAAAVLSRGSTNHGAFGEFGVIGTRADLAAAMSEARNWNERVAGSVAYLVPVTDG